MAEQWPSSLPQAPLLGARQPFADNRIVSDVEVGPSKVRRRSTVAGGQTQYRFILTDAQARTFKIFYETTLSDGVRPLALKDRLGNEANFRITAIPDLTERGGAWDLKLDLEVVP